MPYFRVSIEDYIEGEYDTEEKAIDDFIEALDQLDIRRSVTVEEFNEETGRWE